MAVEAEPRKNVLVVDVGGTKVKLKATSGGDRQTFHSGSRLTAQNDYVAIGGGNASLLEKLPDGVETCPNENAFVGGFRLWDDAKLATD